MSEGGDPVALPPGAPRAAFPAELAQLRGLD
jgi:hypothetical protein